MLVVHSLGSGSILTPRSLIIGAILAAGAPSIALAQAAGGAAPVVIPTGPTRMVRPVAAPAAAQRAAEPLLNSANFRKHAALLELDAEQSQAAMMLHETYAAESKRLEAAMRSKIDAAMEDMQDGDPAALRQGGSFATAMQEAAAERKRLKSQFIADLKAILTPAQAGNFEAFDRALRRDAWAPRGTLAGSSVNLFTTVDQLKLDQATLDLLAPTLNDYGVDLDRALREREDFASKQASGGAVRTFDLESFRALSEQRSALDVKVREVNERYARLLAAQLPEAHKRSFEDALKQSMFRQVYRASRAERKAQAAAKLAGLAPDQQAKLTDALARYRAGLPSANARWADAIQKAERSGTPASGGIGGLQILTGGDKPDLADARKARQDLDKQLDEAIKTALTPEQLDELKASTGRNAGAVAGKRVEMNVTTDGTNTQTFTHEVEFDDDDLEDALVLAGGPGSGGGVLIIRDEKVNVGPGPGQPPQDDQKKDDTKKDEPNKNEPGKP